MNALLEETLIEFFGKELYKFEGLNPQALATLNMETELTNDLGLDEFQLKHLVSSFKDQFKVDCCEKQLEQLNAKLIFFLEKLLPSSFNKSIEFAA